MEASSPATAELGTRISCAAQTPSRHSTVEAKPRRDILRPSQTVLVHDHVKVMNRCRHALRYLNRKRLRRLRQQRAIHITIRNPNDLAAVVVKAGDHVRDIDCLAALV